ncbi:unnamed protein product [Owenia fusiformis]|uniref:Negative elongation factor B n=2 Tax=Owenia fusiformis TaxID=6347 RepID=A0A8S4P2D2_OWEFU|nr:unnamed protein product [Owenia fusiformis]
MSNLEELGFPGSAALRDALTSCADPLQAIETFQVENGILLPSLRPSLPFLDLHGVKRLEFHTSIMEELRERLIQQVTTLSQNESKGNQKILNELLEKSFPVIKSKTMRPVVMAVMKHIPKIKQEYLKKIMEDDELYKESSTEVKRQIWQDNQALFGDEVSPLLSKYIEDKEHAIYGHENEMAGLFTPSPKNRRQMEVIRKLVHMVGRNVKLYDMVLQFLRTLYLRTRNIHYCTLRAEILMALHDGEVTEICNIDPCRKFTWCLDACIRERFVDEKRAKELQGFLDGVRKGQEQVLGDLSMILCDPFAVNTICLSTIKCLQHCVNVDMLPRENGELILLLRMLSLGLGAWDMIDSQDFKEPKLDSLLILKFLPAVVTMMVDDQLNTVITKISDNAKIVTSSPGEFFSMYLRQNAVASTMLLHYALLVSRQKDKAAVEKVMPYLGQCENDRGYEDTFLHAFVANLISMSEEFQDAEFMNMVIDDFFMASLSKENVFRHMLRLLWHIHFRIPPAKLDATLSALEPTSQHSEAVHNVYRSLMERVASYQPSPVAVIEKLDSPLLSVPAPTPGPMTPMYN